MGAAKSVGPQIAGLLCAEEGFAQNKPQFAREHASVANGDHFDGYESSDNGSSSSCARPHIAERSMDRAACVGSSPAKRRGLAPPTLNLHNLPKPAPGKPLDASQRAELLRLQKQVQTQLQQQRVLVESIRQLPKAKSVSPGARHSSISHEPPDSARSAGVSTASQVDQQDGPLNDIFERMQAWEGFSAETLASPASPAMQSSLQPPESQPDEEVAAPARPFTSGSGMKVPSTGADAETANVRDDDADGPAVESTHPQDDSSSSAPSDGESEAENLDIAKREATTLDSSETIQANLDPDGPYGPTTSLGIDPLINGPANGAPSVDTPTAFPVVERPPFPAQRSSPGRGLAIVREDFLVAIDDSVFVCDEPAYGDSPPTPNVRTYIDAAVRRMFRYFSTDDLSRIVGSFREWRLPSRTTIVEQGSPISEGPGLCVLVQGVIDVLHCPKGATESEKVCTYDRCGQCFGELELLYDTPRGGPSGGGRRRQHWATITTRTPSTVWTVSRKVLQNMVHGTSVTCPSPRAPLYH